MVRRLQSSTIAFCCVAVFGLSTLAQEAHAQFRMRIEQQGCVVSQQTPICVLEVPDNGAGDTDATVGSIVLINQNVGTFNIASAAGLSKPMLGNGTTRAEMGLTSLVVSSLSGGTLMILLRIQISRFPTVP